MTGPDRPVHPDRPDHHADPATRVAEGLWDAGVTVLYGVPGGGNNLDVIGAFERQGGRFVLVHGETAAAIMAGTHGELTGRPGACLVTRGPGLASAVNGLAQALLDRQPMVVIADCVAASDRSRISHQRLDQPALVSEVCAASFTIGIPAGDGPSTGASSSEDAFVASAIGRSMGSRPGPVHLDVDPTAESVCNFDIASEPAPTPGDVGGRVAELQAALDGAISPVLVVGVGAVAVHEAERAGLRSSVIAFAERLGSTVLTTYKARGLFPDSSPSFGGVMTGATIEHDALASADLIVGIGLDPVEFIPGAWRYTAPVVLLGPWPVDDSTFFGDRVVLEIVGGVGPTLDAVAGSLVREASPQNRARHVSAFGQRAKAELLETRPTTSDGVAPHDVVRIARQEAPFGAIATVDAGAHMLPAMVLWDVDAPYELLISSGLATMGFSLPAAIAAAVVHPDRRIVCFIGDGGLGMVMGELETVARLQLKVTVVIFNDAGLSLIAAKQRPTGQGGRGAVGYSRSDFAAIGAAFGLDSYNAADAVGYRAALQSTFATGGPGLIDVRVDPASYPAVVNAVRGRRQ